MTYRGPAEAHFQNPPGVLKGTATASFDEHGRSEITFNVDLAKSSLADTNQGVLFLSGVDVATQAEPGPIQLTAGCANTCTEVRIEADGGELLAVGDDVQYGMSFGSSNTLGLSFSPLRSVFTARQGGQPLQWVMPSVDFLTKIPRLFGVYPDAVLRSPLLFMAPPPSLVGRPLEEWSSSDIASGW